ncbi:penicillin-binding protein 1C [Parasulfitobacter algicola]|uniref:peptidoglycan glycosyltransferase n=1 Tax=Parasulfitobacter algicola TaxID=2614809 RepID=A0ABX2IK00_9RHOB|nr:penicillin-binding protein 1C [Sulfitobacter algicola]NSX53202.1 penicillin-binding protein 1C [Sulfitobacter algicola]
MKRYALFIVAALLLSGAAMRDQVDGWIDATDLPVLTLETSVEVRDRDGRLMRAYTVADGRWRLAVSLDQVDPGYLDMLIAYEDKRFYRHSGVDILAMLRALRQAVWEGEIVSGASTLTMQVARLLEDGTTGQWQGKLRQVRVAMALERRLSKQQILELYLTLAPYGGNVEGVRTATFSYFGKEPSRLTPAQSALLIALPQSPEARRPDRYSVRAKAARDRVIARVIDDPSVASVAQAEILPTTRRPFPSLAPHLSDRVVADHPVTLRHDLTLQADVQMRLQALAAQAVRPHGERLSIAIVVMDHQNGQMVASVGSAGYQSDRRQGHVDMTRALRSPGSTLKPLIYGIAFDQGIAHPETIIADIPRDFGGYAPQNFDGEYRGDLRVREALQQSLNTTAVLLTETIGPNRFVGQLRKSGANPVIPGGKPGLAVALGGVGLTLEDMVQLYAGLANGGLSVPMVFKKTDVPDASKRLMNAEAAWHIGDILSGITPPPNAPRDKVAFKTGTSYGHRDAWAIGYDGQHVIGVWMGRPDGTPVPGAFGGDLAAPILFQAFSRVKPDFAPLSAPPPATLIVGTADLPQPLQRFRALGDWAAAAVDAPDIAFPPNGAVVESDGVLFAKVRNGVAPFTWIVNGAPMITAARDRTVELSNLPKGFHTLAVVDAKGMSSRSNIQLR